VVRLLALAIVGCLVYLIVRATVRAFLAGLGVGGRSAAPRRAGVDQLVKDPVCETYIPRRKAISRGSGPATRYFCSAACADKFAAGS
jgi:YHS domain-containing protein